MSLEPGAKIIAQAITPQAPIDSRPKLTFGAALLGALLVGSLAALGLERLDQTVRDAEQIENLVELPTLASIPAIAGAHRWHKAPDRHVLDDPDSPFNQAVTALAATLCARDRSENDHAGHVGGRRRRQNLDVALSREGMPAIRGAHGFDRMRSAPTATA
jgi:hypothetical protein